MRYHACRRKVQTNVHGQTIFYDEWCFSVKAYKEEAHWRDRWIREGYIARVEDMKTRQLVFNSFQLQDATWFAVNGTKQPIYRKLIHYWNARKSGSPSKLAMLMAEEKRWQRRLTIAKNKLRAVGRKLKREQKLCQSLTTKQSHINNATDTYPLTTSSSKS